MSSGGTIFDLFEVIHHGYLLTNSRYVMCHSINRVQDTYEIDSASVLILHSSAVGFEGADG
jgi:hypothetical protein